MTHISPRLLSVLIVILSALLLTGCGTQNTDAASTTSDTTQNTNTELADLKNLLPERGAEISGTVKKVVGNIYSIETIDMSGVE
jgi:PBP1b-binding outer membrane lipoprotein LpoB